MVIIGFLLKRVHNLSVTNYKQKQTAPSNDIDTLKWNPRRSCYYKVCRNEATLWTKYRHDI